MSYLPMNEPDVRAKSRKRLDWAPLWAMTALWFSVFLLLPAEVYLRNQSDLLNFFGEALRYGVGLALGATLLTSGLVALLRGVWRQRVVALAIIVTFLWWVHGYVLGWSYGVLDGSSIDWAAWRGREAIDIVLWAGGLVLAWVLAPRIYRQAGLAALALLFMQAASLTIHRANAYASSLDFFKNFYVEKESIYRFSQDRNVVVIVLDEFQSDVFSEVVYPNPTYAAGLEGFTYFPNTLAGFNYTEFAIPAILTGRIYDNQVTREAFLREAYLGPSLPRLLREGKFRVELYPWRGFANESIYYDETVADNFQRRPVPAAKKRIDFARLLDLSLFRGLPQFAKRWVHQDSRWWLGALAQRRWAAAARAGAAASSEQTHELQPGFTQDRDFVNWARGAPDAVAGEDVRPVFKFFHLAGLHVPVRFNRDLVEGEYDYNRANYGEHAEAYAQIMIAFMEQLKRQGLYDQTMIIIAGDHGSGRTRDMFIGVGPDNLSTPMDRYASKSEFQHEKARGSPLFLVKPFGARGPLQRAEQPVSVIDISATVLAALNLPLPKRPALDAWPEFRSQPVFAVDPAASRPRYFGAIKWAAERSDYVNPISLWRVDGPVWEDSPWSFVDWLKAPTDAAEPESE